MFYSSHSEDKTQREIDLELELEQAREAEEQRREAENKRREQQRLEREEQRELNNRTAETWPEALRKQAYLHGRESAELDDPDGEFGEPDAWFADVRDSCTRAAEIWKQVEEEKRPEIESLEKQITVLKRSVRFKVADLVAAESTSPGSDMVVGSLREIEEDPGALSNWLYW